MRYVCALIVVEDIQRSRYLYETVLGQTVKADFGQNVTFVGDFAIHQKEHFRGLIGNAPVLTRANNCELYFEDDDLDRVVAKVRQCGLSFVHDITEQPWRQRVVRFYDYDGNIVEIGERMEHVAFRLSRENLSIAEICRITYLPEEVVRVAIAEYARRPAES